MSEKGCAKNTNAVVKIISAMYLIFLKINRPMLFL